MTGHRAADLDPQERGVDRVLSAATPVPPPLGFRDAVMRRIGAGERAPYEWPLAAALALPSLAFIAWSLAVEGVDMAVALENVFALATGTQQQAFFFVDGLLVLAFAFLGIGALVGSHALVARPEHRTR